MGQPGSGHVAVPDSRFSSLVDERRVLREKQHYAANVANISCWDYSVAGGATWPDLQALDLEFDLPASSFAFTNSADNAPPAFESGDADTVSGT